MLFSPGFLAGKFAVIRNLFFFKLSCPQLIKESQLMKCSLRTISSCKCWYSQCWAVPGFLCRALVVKTYPSALCLSSQACCLYSLDHQEPRRYALYSHYRSQRLLPLITLAVTTSNWDAARKISFRECVKLYGLSQSTGLFALLICSRSYHKEAERSDA
jgi:hypothetical protein